MSGWPADPADPAELVERGRDGQLVAAGGASPLTPWLAYLSAARCRLGLASARLAY
jgi:hypothetical protein